MEKQICAGIIQMAVQCGNRPANLEAALAGIDKLAGQGGQLAVLPELWSCGFDNKNLAVQAGATFEILDILSSCAVSHQMVIAGSLPEAERNKAGEQKIFNTLFVLDQNGRLAGKYRKIHLFSMAREDRYFEAGHSPVVCETSIGQLGLMICYDLRFPELCRSLTLQQADLIIVCAQWPQARIGHWQILAQARAIENQIHVIAANGCGQDEKVIYGGHSLLVSPAGEVLSSAQEKAKCLRANLNLDQKNALRTRMPCLGERRPDIYGTI